MRSQIKDLEIAEFWQTDVNDKPPQDIFAFNELRSCADLFRMYNSKLLDIQPEFQRDFAWNSSYQTRFIDSLIKQLPIPSLCFSYDAKQQKWLVIDGLQRISTIIRFLSGDDWKLSKLDDIEPRISGVSAATIKAENDLSEFYTRVENSTIPITVLRCDYSDKKHLSYLFTVFHRLNSTGLKLNNQEIRNCIYAGSMNRLLGELDNFPDWRKLNKMKPGQYYRLQKQELILRFFAFYEQLEQYTGNLASFLNTYMEQKRFLSDIETQNYRSLFKDTSKILYAALQTSGYKGKVSLTLQTALCYAVGRNLELLKCMPYEEVGKKLIKVIEDPAFSESELSEGLAKKERLIHRMQIANKHLLNN